MGRDLVIRRPAAVSPVERKGGRPGLLGTAAGLALLLGIAPSQAQTISNVIFQLSNQSANNANFATGTDLLVRATDNSTLPLYGFIRDTNGTTVPATVTNQSLFFRTDAALGNNLVASFPYSTTSTGTWVFHLSTSSNPATFGSPGNLITPFPSTPTVGATVGYIPFVNTMTISSDATGLNPTISWTMPTATQLAAWQADPTNPTNTTACPSCSIPTINQVQITISDNSDRIPVTNVNPFSTSAVVPFGNSFQQSNIIYGSTPFSPAQTTFTIPSTNDNPFAANAGQTLLQYGHDYSIGIILEHTTTTPPAGCAQCTVDSRSISFFDYTPINPASLPAGVTPADIYLPTTTAIPTTSGAFAGPVYSFDVQSVSSTSTTYIDPVVATGFDYKIGAGDPNFASVTPITLVGSGIYHLLVWDGTQFVLLGDILAGSTFNFLTNGFANGVTEFEITGIDPGAGLDPTNITAFITGLTFTGPGSFTGTMQALTEVVPLPAAWLLMLTGIGGAGFMARRGRKGAIASPAVA